MTTDAYLVSARKYRPQRWDTVVGQESVTSTLKKAVATGEIGQAYLFCGPRGVGKTTCARIFAKAINEGTEETTPESGLDIMGGEEGMLEGVAEGVDEAVVLEDISPWPLTLSSS